MYRFTTFTRSLALIHLRNRMVLFWNLLFPVLMLVDVYKRQVFGCFGVPLVSAATPHLAQQFRSIIETVPFVNTLLGNWLTNFQIGRLNLVFSLINPLVVAYTSLDTLSYPFLTPTFKLIAFPFCLSSGRVAARSRLADLPLWPGVTNKRKRLGPD